MAAPQQFYSDHARLLRLRRLLTWLAATVAIVIAVAVPVIYLLTAYKYETHRVERTAHDVPETVSGFIYIHPDLWEFSTNRLEKMLLSHIGDAELRQLIGPSDDIIAASQPVSDGGAPQAPNRLSIEGSAEVFNGQIVIGTIRVTESLSPVLIATGWITVFGTLLAIAVFAILRALPLRALDNALNHLQRAHTELQDRIRRHEKTEDELLASEKTLQQRVADLEEAQRTLEQQGADLVRMADDLLITRDEARAADRAKSEFLAAMSHELRTPMNAVLGFSEIMRSETLGPIGNTKYREYADDIHESGKHLLGLINDILDLSKIESGTDELHEDTIEIPKIIHSALKLVAQRAELGAIKLQIEIADQLPALRADERKLKQILVNLLSNAIKFSEAGDEVALWAWCRVDRGHVFQIIDTGIGIAPEDIPKALSRFGQVDADLNRQYEGTGLGLPLTKVLVEQHGGTLDLQSQVGVGTTVIIRFPAARIVRSPHDAISVIAADMKVS